MVIAGDFNHPLSRDEVDEWLPGLAQRGISFALHDGNTSICKAADQRFRQMTPDAAAAAICNSITYRALGLEIDRICSMVPSCTGSSGHVGGSQPPPALICIKAAATCVTVHAGFNHGPRMAHFTLTAGANLNASGL